MTIEYERTYYLLHPSQYFALWMTPALRPDRRWTVGQSPHDAFIDAPGLSRRRVIAVNPFLWGTEPTLRIWALVNFTPGYELNEVVTATPDTIEQAVDRALGEAVKPVTTVQVWPNLYAFQQSNAVATRAYKLAVETSRPVTVQRLPTSDPDRGGVFGWPL